LSLLVRLALADPEVSGEISLADFPGLLLDPAIEPDFADAAEIVEFYVVP